MKNVACLVFSAGRSGTNLILETLCGNSYFIPTSVLEDKLVFKHQNIYNRYLSKSDIVYCSNYNEFKELMDKNQHLKIIWTIRHPYDMCLSKMYRGWPTKKRNYKRADDSSISGCILDMYNMFSLYLKAIKDYPNRIMIVKMENLILDIEDTSKEMCEWLNIDYEEEMKFPHKKMRHVGKRERYGNKLDKSQINLWKNINNEYSKFLLENDIKINLDSLFRMVDPIVKYFKYRNGCIF